MAFCRNCGENLSDADIFCSNCGTRVQPTPQAQPQIPVEEPTVMERPPVVLETTAPVTQAKKKSRKLVWILIPILVVALLGAAVGGLLLMANMNYKQAQEALDNREYEQALELFGKFSFYKDSKQQVKRLTQNQRDYDEAMEALADHDFEDARDLFEDLDDYRDSEEMAQFGVDYQQALYEKEQAIGSEDGDTILLACADTFRRLGEAGYQDAQEQVSGCYREAAICALIRGDFDSARSYESSMNSTDLDQYREDLKAYCADGELLATLEECVRKRLEMEEAYDNDEDITHREMVDMEYDVLSEYEARSDIYNVELYDFLSNYLYTLELQYENMGSSDYFDAYNASGWYQAKAQQYDVLVQMMEAGLFLPNDSELQAQVLDLPYICRGYAAIEEILMRDLIGLDPELSENYGYYFVVNNDTEYTYTLKVDNQFLDDSGEELLYLETETYTIAPGEQMIVSITYPDEDYKTWYVYWWYDVVM